MRERPSSQKRKGEVERMSASAFIPVRVPWSLELNLALVVPSDSPKKLWNSRRNSNGFRKSVDELLDVLIDVAQEFRVGWHLFA